MQLPSAGCIRTYGSVFESLIGEIGLFLLSWVMFHHMIGGVKHLVQDTGKGLGKEETTRFAYMHVALSAGLTILVWIVGMIVN